MMKRLGIGALLMIAAGCQMNPPAAYRSPDRCTCHGGECACRHCAPGAPADAKCDCKDLKKP